MIGSLTTRGWSGHEHKEDEDEHRPFMFGLKPGELDARGLQPTHKYYNAIMDKIEEHKNGLNIDNHAFFC